MEVVLKIFAVLTLLLGAFVLLGALMKGFSHKGMTIAGICYFLGGSFSLYTTSWWPAIAGIIVATGIRRQFGEPDYSLGAKGIGPAKGQEKSTYQLWCEKYRPIMAVGEPMNYLRVLPISNMTKEEQDTYLKEKINSNLFWTVIDSGKGIIKVKPGRHEGKVVAWWFCDVPYSNAENEIEIQF